MLERMEREVKGKIAKLRLQLTPLERELADIRKAKAGLLSKERVRIRLSDRPRSFAGGGAPLEPCAPLSPYQDLTIKQLVNKALREHFPDGATANQLLKLFADAWDRNDIERTSLSPQLSRLKQEGKISRHKYTWRLAEQEEASDESPSGETAGVAKEPRARVRPRLFPKDAGT